MAQALQNALRTQIQTLVEHLAAPIPPVPQALPTNEQTLEAYQQVKSGLEEDLLDIRAAMQAANNIHDSYMTYLTRFSANALPAAEAAYNDFIADQNFVDRMRLAGNLTRTFRQRINELQRLSTPLQVAPAPAAPPPPAAVAPDPNAQIAALLPLFTAQTNQLKTFDGKGNFLNWWETYKTMIHENPSFPQELKFPKLMTLLEGTAEKIVSGFEQTPANYAQAIDLLKKHYINDDQEIDDLYKSLSRLSVCTNFSELKKFHLELEVICRRLISRGKTAELESPFICAELERKLTKPVKREILKKKTAARAWNTTAFRTALSEIIQLEEHLLASFDTNIEEKKKKADKPVKKENEKDGAYAVSTNVNKQHHNNQTNSAKTKHPKGAKGAKTTQCSAPSRADSNKSPRAKYPCGLCEVKGHFPADCRNFPTLESRNAKCQELGRCTRCFRQGHNYKSCETPLKPCFECKGSHHKIFCKTHMNQKFSAHSIVPPPQREKQPPAVPEQNQCGAVVLARKFGNRPTTRTLMCKRVSVFNPNDEKLKTTILVFFDAGSHRTFISPTLVQKLKLKSVGIENFSISVFATNSSKPYKAEVFLFGVMTPKGDIIIEADRVPKLVGEMEYFETEKMLSDDFELQKLPEPSFCAIPDVLVGIDQLGMFQPKFIKELRSGFTLWQSLLGSHVCGRGVVKPQAVSCIIEPASNVPICKQDAEEDISMQRLIKRCFDNETNQVEEGDECKKAIDQQVLDHFEKTIEKVNGRYEVRLPWNQRLSELPPNYALAVARLRSNAKTLRKNSELMKRYHSNLMELLDANIIEKVDKPFDAVTGPLHYLPHQVVLREDKPNKIRIVFDASSRMSKNTPSLNETLHRGPVMLPDLAGLLLRFRTYPYVLACDIKKAFLQIAIAKQDRDATRFVWLREPFNAKKDDEMNIYRFKAVTFGLICSPFLLAATIRHHASKYQTKLAREIEQNMYVDNFIKCLDKPDKLIEAYHEIKTLFNEASMPVREFVSNARKELEQIPLEERLTESEVKVLGIKWNTAYDYLTISTPKIKEDEIITKRMALSAIATPFDPLGLISPALLKGRRFISQLWENEISWDTPLDDSLSDEWKRLMVDWTDVQIKIPRLVISNQQALFEIHAFSDASETGLGTAIYLRTESNKKVTSNLIFAKSKIVPRRLLKKDETISNLSKAMQSMPRLELQATVNTINAVKFVKAQLAVEIKHTQIYTDSKCVVDWLKGSKEKSKYEERRLKHIREFYVQHVSGVDNPADIASRGLSPKELTSNEHWFFGPSWLKAHRGLRPAPLVEYDPTKEAAQSEQPAFFEICASTHEETCTNVKNTLMNFTRFSQFKRIRRTIAYVFRFIKVMKENKTFRFTITEFRLIVGFKPSKKGKTERTLTLEEINNSEQFLLKEAQRIHPPKENISAALDLYTDQKGIIRCRGRLGKSQLPFQTSDPIYLPRKAQITTLIIMNLHQQILHAGPSILLAELRQLYWLPQAKREINSIIYVTPKTKCMRCARMRIIPYSSPPEPPLPEFRVQKSAPFAHTGLDYFGPLYIKKEKQRHKIWVAIFTCLSTRCIHLEVVEDMTTHRFILAFRRFISRRATPQSVLSDNATQFVLGSKIVSELWHAIFSSNEMKDFVVERKIKWRFITPKAPWCGATYERLISSVKKSLRASIGLRTLYLDEFSTILTEIELIVNKRPITYINDRDCLTPLRPIDFLIPLNNEIVIDHFNDDESDPDYVASAPKTRDNVIQLLKRTRSVVEKFWTQWSEHYLTALRERQKASKKAKKFPSAGDVVLIHDDEKNKMFWQLAKIKELIPSSDGHIRSAIISKGPGELMKRAISHLYPMEIESVCELTEPLPQKNFEPEKINFINNNSISVQAVSDQIKATSNVRKSKRLASKTVQFSDFVKKVEGFNEMDSRRKPELCASIQERDTKRRRVDSHPRFCYRSQDHSRDRSQDRHYSQHRRQENPIIRASTPQSKQTCASSSTKQTTSRSTTTNKISSRNSLTSQRGNEEVDVVEIYDSENEYEDERSIYEERINYQKGVFYSNALSLTYSCSCPKPTVGELVQQMSYGYRETLNMITKKSSVEVASMLHGMLILLHLGESDKQATKSLLNFIEDNNSCLPQWTFSAYEKIMYHFQAKLPLTTKMLQKFIIFWMNNCICLQKEIVSNNYVISLELTASLIASDDETTEKLRQLKRNVLRAASLIVKPTTAKWITTKHLVLGDKLCKHTLIWNDTYQLTMDESSIYTLTDKIFVGEELKTFLLYFGISTQTENNNSNQIFYLRKINIICQHLLEFGRDTIIIAPPQMPTTLKEKLRSLTEKLHAYFPPPASISVHFSETSQQDASRVNLVGYENELTEFGEEVLFEEFRDVLNLELKQQKESYKREKPSRPTTAIAASIIEPVNKNNEKREAYLMKTLQLLAGQMNEIDSKTNENEEETRELRKRITEELYLLLKSRTFHKSKERIRYFYLIPTGSSFTGLDISWPKHSDLDLCFYLEEVDDEKAAFNDLWHALEFSAKSGFNLIKKVERRDRRNVPYLEVILHPEALNVTSIPFEIQININGWLGIYNSHLIGAYMKSQRARCLAKILKLWGKNNKAIDSQSGGFNSHAMNLLVIFFLQRAKVLPNLQQLYPRSFSLKIQPDELENITRIHVPGGECSDNCGQLLRNFFKYWAGYDFSTNAVSIQEGRSLPRSVFGNPAAQMIIAEPFDPSDNVARTIQTPQQKEIIRNKFKQAYASLKAKPRLESIGLSEDAGRLAKPSSRSCITSSIAILTLITFVSSFFSTHGQPPKMCVPTPSFWRILPPKCAEPFDNPHTTKTLLRLYRPNNELRSLVATWCSTIHQSAKYKTDLLNRHELIANQSQLTTSREECERMKYQRSCRYGNLNGGTTLNHLKIDWSFWSIGYSHASATNCFLQQTTISVNPAKNRGRLENRGKVLVGCELEKLYCPLENGDMLIWDFEQESEKYCTLVKFAELEGTITNGEWQDDEEQLALSFSRKPIHLTRTGCPQKLTLSEQGLAVEHEDYLKYFSQAEKPKKNRYRRTTRYDSIASSFATTEQLAAQLTSLTMSVNRFMHTAKRKSCLETYNSTLNSDATSAARKLLKMNNVKAKWIGRNILEVYQCAQIPWNEVIWKPNKRCYNKPVVHVHNVSWHLNTHTLTLDTSAREVDCRRDNDVYFTYENKVKKIRQTTGELFEIGYENLHEIDFLIPASTGKENKVELPIFKKLIITNFTIEQQVLLNQFDIVKGLADHSIIEETEDRYSLKLWSINDFMPDVEKVLLRATVIFVWAKLLWRLQIEPLMERIVIRAVRRRALQA